jgi:hypothetical protein
VDRVVGLEGVRVDIAMLETPDGHGRLELMKFNSPPAQGGDQNAPPNTFGILRIAFAVDDKGVEPWQLPWPEWNVTGNRPTRNAA